MSHDPKRLFEADSEAPDALRGLLIEARGVAPTAQQTARLAAKLGPLLGAGIAGDSGGLSSGSSAGTAAAGAAAAGAGGSTLAGLSGAMKLTAALAFTGAVAGGAVWLQRSEPSSPPVEVPAMQQPPPSAVPVADPKPAPAETAADTAPSEPGPEPESTARRPHSRELAAQSSGASAKASEAELLEQARAALKRDPAAALKLTREHARRFPGGALAQEREIIAIDALSRLNRAGEASARAQEFKKRYPGSAHQRKLDTLGK